MLWRRDYCLLIHELYDFSAFNLASLAGAERRNQLSTTSSMIVRINEAKRPSLIEISPVGAVGPEHVTVVRAVEYIFSYGGFFGIPYNIILLWVQDSLYTHEEATLHLCWSLGDCQIGRIETTPFALL